MEILVNGSKLNNTLRTAKSLIGDSVPFVTLRFDGKNDLWVYQEGKKEEPTKVGIKQSVTGKNSGIVTVNSETLSGLTKRNQDLLISYNEKDQELSISNQSKYKAKCLAVPVMESMTKVINKKKTSIMSPMLYEMMIEAFSGLAIKDYFSSELPIIMSVWASKKKTIIVGSDNYHGGLYSGKGTVDFEFHLPIDYALRLPGLLKDHESVEMSVDSSNLYLWNQDIQLSYPLIAPHKGYSLDTVKETFVELDSSAEFSNSKFKTIITNFHSLYETQRLSYLEIDSNKDNLKLSTKTTRGQASETIEFEKGKIPKAKVHVNPNLLSGIISLIPEKFKLGLIGSEGKYLRLAFETKCQHGKIFYHVLLSDPYE